MLYVSKRFTSLQLLCCLGIMAGMSDVQGAIQVPCQSRLHAQLTPQSYDLGAVQLVLSQHECGRWKVSLTRERDGKTIWSHRAGYPFVVAQEGKDEVLWQRGSFLVRDHVASQSQEQSIQRIETRKNVAVLIGELEGGTCSGTYRMQVKSLSDHDVQVRLSLGNTQCNRLVLSSVAKPQEHIFGFGAQTRFDMKGYVVPILSQEQGHGRGTQPLTGLGRRVIAGESIGRWWSSYASVPFYMNDHGLGVLAEEKDYMEFDFRTPNQSAIKIHGTVLTLRLFSHNNPLELIEASTEYMGRQPLLPEWLQRGPILSLQGGQETVERKLDILEQSNIPVGAIWIQDWTGTRRGLLWERLWWDWQLDRKHYPRWEDIVGRVKRKGWRLLTYVNPRLSDKSHGTSEVPSLFRHALDLGYLVRDRDGGILSVDSAGVEGALVDLSNPDGRNWLKDILRSEYIAKGVDGWMADFGESLPLDAQLASGETGAKAHHDYIETWARLNREVLVENGLENDGLFMMRAGHTRTSKHIPLYWLGDQMTSWDGNDGLRSTVTLLLTSGVSGMAVNHSDTGGMISLLVPGLWNRRDRELFLRWLEVNTFTAVLRTHVGTNPKLIHQYDSDSETLASFGKFARLYVALAPYRQQLLQEASATGIPVVRHPYLHDPKAKLLESYDQFMLGPDVFVAPVLDKGQRTRDFVLPDGQWIHLWSGKEFGPGSGSVSAPIGQPPVFYRGNSSVGALLQAWVVEESLKKD